jgi:CCR4-NOT transcriptional regulation complex NOT5 subunit
MVGIEVLLMKNVVFVTNCRVLEAKKKFDEFKVTEKLSEIKADIKEDLDEARAVGTKCVLCW